MKKSKDISGIFKKISKLPTENIKTLSQKQKVKDIFSPSQDMTECVGNGGKLLEEQDSLLKARTTIRIVGWCSFSNKNVWKSSSLRKELTEAVGPSEKVGLCSYSEMPLKWNQRIRVRD